MKNIGCVLIFLLTTTVSYGQNFEAYIIGGVSFSQIDGDKLAGYNKVGLVAGGMTSFELKGGWSFQQEIVYYQRGSKATVEQLSLDNFSIKRLDYIDIIAQAKYALNDKWGLLAGLGYGAFVNVKSDVTENKSLYKSDLFGTIGVEYQLTDNLFTVLKGQYSMLSIFEIQNAYNNSLNVSLRYKFFQ